MAFKAVFDSILASSDFMIEEVVEDGRGGREGCVGVSWESSEAMSAAAASLSEAEGSLSIYGRDSWTSFVSDILLIA